MMSDEGSCDALLLGTSFFRRFASLFATALDEANPDIFEMMPYSTKDYKLPLIVNKLGQN